MQRRQPLPLPSDRRQQQTVTELGRRVDYEKNVHDADRRIMKDATGKTSVSITGGASQVFYHNLGRQLTGWRVIRTNADSRVWETASDNNTVTLAASNTVTLTVEGF